MDEREKLKDNELMEMSRKLNEEYSSLSENDFSEEFIQQEVLSEREKENILNAIASGEISL